MKWKDIPLIIVAGYVIYKIGFVDGWTAVNGFLLLCLLLSCVYTVKERTGLGKEEQNDRDIDKK